MDTFEKNWRKKILHNTKKNCNSKAHKSLEVIQEADSVLYSKEVIQVLRATTLEDKIKRIFCNSACHIPHQKLDRAKQVYEKTKSISKTRQVLEDDFKIDIKKYKKLSDEQVTTIIENGWGLAGIQKFDNIIATKIPSMFHEYFSETDEKKKKFYYCHCPRIRKNLLDTADIDSIYCNCGGGFYSDIWEYITGSPVEITVLKNLFDGDDVCQFLISFHS